MDLESILIGVILIVICIIPVVLLRNNSTKKRTNLIKAVKKLAEQQNCELGQFEVCGDLIIAFDQRKKHVFFHRTIQSLVEEKSIDLESIQSCKFINTITTLMNNFGESKTEIDKLELCFKPKNNESEIISLEFFNSKVNFQIYDELLVIQKWSKLIEEQLA
ncbi:MAG: hypothetical protein FGM14_12035 [Flavobacteriales bacterium]|nr:hypothetical protein [Flavobacteriales bacterium]